ncbi:MAG TPA: S53 family peptidase [Terriglobales bacterium]
MTSVLSGLLKKAFFCVLTVFAISAWAAAPQSRISQAIDSSQWAPIKANVHPFARPEFDKGRTATDEKISGSIAFKLSATQQADLNQLLAAQQNLSSPSYHKWLTPEQYANRFGMSKSDIAKVASWLQAQGLTVSRVARGGNEVFFTGTAGQVEYAFHTELHNYAINGNLQYANASAPNVPLALANMVLGIRGLDNFRPKAHNTFRTVRPNFTSSVSGNHFIAPGDFATIYNVKPLYTAGNDGTGQKIAIVGQTLIAVTDMEAFRTASGLAKNDPTLLLIPGSGTGTTCSGDIGEADLDVEWSGAVAKNASIIFVFTGVDTGKTCTSTSQNVFNSLNYAFDNNVAPVISTSYGFCEAGLTKMSVDIIRSWVQQGNTQGQTLIAASGDDGAADCDTGTSATQGLAVDAPASIPEVTGVGGTEFNGDAAGSVTGTAPNTNAGSTAFWSGTTGSTDTLSSALSYIPEMAWNDTANDIAAGGTLSSTGGGASIFYAKPSWQTGTGVPADGKRDVPDVALNASADHDGYLICSQGSCTTGFRDGSGGLTVVGGTSVGAPTFAGIVALINQATNSIGLGNINPVLYGLASTTPSVFHDITTGDNKVPCTMGTTGCASGGTIGFSATAGYDQVTGLGSVDASALANAFPIFSGFSVASNPETLSVVGGQPTTTALTITGTNAFSGTVNLTCTSSSTRATCTVSPASVNLDSTTTSASSTLNIATTSGSALIKTSADNRHSMNWLAGTAGLGIVSICLLVFPSKQRNGLLIFCLAAFLVTGVGCGGGSSSSSSTTGTGGSGTTSTSATISVIATDGTTTRTTTIALTVQ